MKKPIPVGNEDFRDIIDKGYYYVDKTLLIKELLEYKGFVNLFMRPRRFGKTLSVSMLKYFFEKTGEGNNRLFEGLKIMSEPSCLEHMGRYPVVSISFKSGKQGTAELVVESIKKVIAEEYRRQGDILKNALVQEDRIQRITQGKGDISDYMDALRLLTECLYRQTGEKVIVLIDEYDIPLENAYFRGFYDEILDFMRALFESVLKTNPFIEFAVITGCLRISRESIFTGLNNVEMIPVTSKMYSEYFGFTNREVNDMLRYYGLETRSEEVRRWYNGYLFGGTEVYNPWSVVNYVKNAWLDGTSRPKPYWSNTSSNDIIRNLAENADVTLKQEIETLISGEAIEKPVHDDITYSEMYKSDENIWSFLFFTGYLKGNETGRWTDDGFPVLSLTIPNLEVNYIYKSKIREWFQEGIKTRDFSGLYRCLLNHETEGMERHLSALLRESISFYDNKEAFYHGFLTGVFQNMSDFFVESNKESGDGRFDISIRSLDVKVPAVILELKLADSFADMEKRAEEAVLQIQSRHYEEKLKLDGYQKIYSYGIAFYKKNCRVKTC